MKLYITFDRASGRTDLRWSKGTTVVFGAYHDASMSGRALEIVASRLHSKLFDALTSIETFSVPITKRKAFARLLRRIAGESVTGFDAEGSAFELIVAIVENANGPTDPEATRARDLVLTTVDFIQDRYREPIGLRHVAFHVDVSAGYLSEFMQHFTGRTVQRWIAHRRVAEAAKLLAATRLPINAISERVGYDDGMSFMRQFQSVAGMSPRAWRDMATQIERQRNATGEDMDEERNFDVSPLFAVLDATGDAIDVMKVACRLACDVSSMFRIDTASRNEKGRWEHRATCVEDAPLLKVSPSDDEWGLRLMTLGLPYTNCALETRDRSFRGVLGELGANAVYASPVFRDGTCVGCVSVCDGTSGAFTNYERGLVDLSSAVLALRYNWKVIAA